MTLESTTEAGISFDRWFERFFDDYMRHRPVDATLLGIRRYDYELPDYSVEADIDRIDNARESIDILDRIPFDGLSETQICDRILARSLLELQIWETGVPFGHAGNPVLHIEEALFGVCSLFRYEHGPLDEQIEAAIHRMNGIPAFLETARTRIVRAPLSWIECAIRDTEAAIAFFTEDIQLLSGKYGIERSDFSRATDLAARAFDEHLRWLRGTLYEHRGTYRPAGTDNFDFLLQHGHLLPAEQTTEWWFDYAHAELIETTRELNELARSIDWKRTWKQQLADLANDHPTPDTYEQTFTTIWQQHRAQVIAADLVTWPDVPVEFHPISSVERRIAGIFPRSVYRAPSPFVTQTIDRVYIPPCDSDMTPAERARVLRSMNDTHILLDVIVRRAGLGSYVQHHHARRSASRIGQIAGIAGGAGRIMFCAGTLVDGWTAYAAELMEEIGVFSGVRQLWEAHARMYLAARAVADTGIHSGELAIGRVAQMFRDEVGLPASDALREAVDISMSPGRGVAGLIGVAAIDELRRQLEDRDGSAFSLRVFHDRLLSFGAVPLTLIATSMLAEKPGDPE